MASEVGVLDIPPENIVVKERLHPGRIFLIDTAQGRIIDDEEIKREVAAAASVRRAGSRHSLVNIEDLPAGPPLDRGRTMTRSCSGRWRSATRRRICGSCSVRWRRTARNRSDRWARTRRWRCCPIARVCSTTTSSSCSRRSPIRRSTRFVKRWSRRWNRRSGPERNLLKPEPESCRQIIVQVPDPRQRPGRQAPPHRPARLPQHRRCRCCSGPARRAGARARRWTSSARAGERGRRRPATRS